MSIRTQNKRLFVRSEALKLRASARTANQVNHSPLEPKPFHIYIYICICIYMCIYIYISFSGYSPSCAGLRSAPRKLRSATFRTSLAYSPTNSEPTFRSPAITFRYVPAFFWLFPYVRWPTFRSPRLASCIIIPQQGGKDGPTDESRDFKENSVVGAASGQTDELHMFSNIAILLQYCFQSQNSPKSNRHPAALPCLLCLAKPSLPAPVPCLPCCRPRCVDSTWVSPTPPLPSPPSAQPRPAQPSPSQIPKCGFKKKLPKWLFAPAYLLFLSTPSQVGRCKKPTFPPAYLARCEKNRR